MITSSGTRAQQEDHPAMANPPSIAHRPKGAMSWFGTRTASAIYLAAVLVAPFLIIPSPFTQAALLLQPVFWLVFLARRRFRITPLEGPLVLFLLAIGLSAALALDPSLGEMKLAGVALGVTVFQGIASVEPRRRNVRRVAGLSIGGGAAIALVAVVAATNWPADKLGIPPSIYDWLPKLAGDLPGTLPGGFSPNEIGGMLTFFVPLAVALAVRPVSWALRSLACVALVVDGGVLVISQARGAILGVVVAILLILAVVNKWLRYLALGTGLLVAGWLVSQGTEGLTALLSALHQPASNLETATFAARVEIWQRALYVVRDFPLTGIGLGSFPSLSVARYPYFSFRYDLSHAHAHNVLLETAVDFGLGGLLALLLLLGTYWLLLWRTWLTARSRTSRALVLGLSGSMTAYLVFGLTDTLNWGAKPGAVFWAYLGAGGLIWAREGGPPLLPAARGLKTALLVGTLALMLALGVAFQGPLISAVENNLAARTLGRAAMPEPGGRLLQANDYDAVVRRLESATTHDPMNVGALRNLAQSHAARGHYEGAVGPLRQAVELEPGNPLVVWELARTSSALGKTEQALALYRTLRAKFPGNEAVADAEVNEALFHQVRVGVEYLAVGRLGDAETAFRRALAVRPGDLFASAYLARTLSMVGENMEATRLRRERPVFSLSTDGRLYERFLPELSSFMLDQGFLKRDDLYRTASFLLWRNDFGAVAAVIDVLSREQTEDDRIWLLRAQRHRQQGNIAAAIADMEQWLARDPGDADRQVRLGQLLQADSPDRALAAYQRALTLAPNNPPALGAVAKLLESAGQVTEANALVKRLAAATSDLAEVSARLGMAPGDFKLMSVPLANASFRFGRPHPLRWSWASWIGAPYFGDALYTGGVDDSAGYGQSRSLRITGLWAERRPQTGTFWLDPTEKRELPRAGFWAPELLLEPDSVYALSFAYRTANWATGNVRVAFVVPETSGGPVDLLPPTGDRWFLRTFLVANLRRSPVVARPLFTSWGVGDAWFADIRLSRVVARQVAIQVNADVARIE